MRCIPRRFAAALAIYLTLAPWASGENQTDGKPSPDGSMILFARHEDGQVVRDIEIYTARLDGSQQRKLTDNEQMDGFPSWSPNGKRIVFISDRSGQSQIYEMDADGKNVRQLTTAEEGVGDKVKYGPDGRIAYTALRERHGKVKLYDVILTDGNVSKTVARQMRITDFAWHPDGNSIVYAGVGQIVFHDLPSDDITVVLCGDIDKRLDSHGVTNIGWRPDKESITCRIEFFGGRSQSPIGAVTKIFGDDELFTISRDGNVSWLTISE